MSAHSVRVAVVAAADGTLAHPRLAACRLDVVAELPDMADLLHAPSHEHEAAVVGCTMAQLADPRFHAQLARLARAVPTVLVAPRLTRNATAVAARARTLGLATRDTSAEELTRTVRSASRGRAAYPAEAITVLLHLLPPAGPRGSSVRAA